MWRGTRVPERIFIVFTVAGGIYVLFVIALFVAARIRTGGGGLPWVLGVALIVVGLVGIILTNDNMGGVQLESVECEAAPEGASAVARVVLANRSSRDRCALTLRFAGRAVWRLRGHVALLPAGAKVTVDVPLPPRARGVFRLPPLVVWSVFPFGIAVAWKRFEPEQERVVYPRPEGPLPLRDSGRERDGRVRADAGLDDVAGHRPFQSGDAPRRVDWRLFARRRELHVRVREDPLGNDCFLRFEDTAVLGDIEARLRQVSRWIELCQGAGRRVHLVLGPGREHSGVERCREALARWGGAT